jgi:hypothetical protein
LNQGLPEAEAGTASLNNLRVNDEFINVFWLTKLLGTLLFLIG